MNNRYFVYFNCYDCSSVLLDDNYILYLLENGINTNMRLFYYNTLEDAERSFKFLIADEFLSNGMLRLKQVQIFDSFSHKLVKNFFTTSEYIKEVLKIKWNIMIIY